jgi:hypothetical protein
MGISLRIVTKATGASETTILYWRCCIALCAVIGLDATWTYSDKIAGVTAFVSFVVVGVLLWLIGQVLPLWFFWKVNNIALT